MTAAPRTLGIDLGSSSLRVAVVDAEGRVVTALRRRFDFRSERTSAGTFAATDVADLLSDALSSIDSTGVTDVAVSALWHSLLGVDDHDRPVSEVFTWESAAPAAGIPSLRDRLEAGAYRERTGSYLHSSYPLAAYWQLRREGRAPARITDLTSWLLRRVLDVEIRWSRQIAAGSGFWHQDRQEWDEVTCTAVGLDPASLGGVWESPVILTGGRAQALGLAGARLHPTLGDGACSNVGLGALGAATGALSVGTSGSLRLVVEDAPPAVPSGLWRYRLSDRLTAIGGANSNVGNLFEWLHARFGASTPKALLAADPPEFDGLLAWPHLNGERGPAYRATSAAGFVGVQSHHTGDDLSAAMIFGTLGTFQRLSELLRATCPQLSLLIASGGVTTAAPWFAQLLADAVALPVAISAEAESSLVGAIAFVTNSRIMPASGQVLSPRPAWTAAIAERNHRSARIEAALTDLG